MAVTSVFSSKNLSIEIPIGKDEKGKDILKKFSFKGVKKDAVEQDLFDLCKEVEKVLIAPASELSCSVKSLLIGE